MDSLVVGRLLVVVRTALWAVMDATNYPRGHTTWTNRIGTYWWTNIPTSSRIHITWHYQIINYRKRLSESSSEIKMRNIVLEYTLLIDSNINKDRKQRQTTTFASSPNWRWIRMLLGLSVRSWTALYGLKIRIWRLNIYQSICLTRSLLASAKDILVDSAYIQQLLWTNSELNNKKIKELYIAYVKHTISKCWNAYGSTQNVLRNTGESKES
jgi:hypothetical protein